MTLIEAIRARHSLRRSLQKPIPDEVLAALMYWIEEVNNNGGLHFEIGYGKENFRWKE